MVRGKVNPRAINTSHERGLTLGNNPKMGCGAVGPSTHNNGQVRRARGKAHVLIKGFSESLPRYVLIQLRFECSKECFYALSMRFGTL